jgi:hypothetical protein
MPRRTAERFDLFRQGRLRHGTIESTSACAPASALMTLDQSSRPEHVRVDFRLELFARAVGERARQHIERMQRESIPMRRIAWRRARPSITAPVETVSPLRSRCRRFAIS